MIFRSCMAGQLTGSLATTRDGLSPTSVAQLRWAHNTKKTHTKSLRLL